MHNVHISLTSMVNESRVRKQTESLISQEAISKISIICLGDGKLANVQEMSEDIIIYRFKLLSGSLPKKIFFQFFKLIEFYLRSFFFVANQKGKIVNVHSLALLPLGALLKFFFNVKLIYDAHELETETHGLVGLKKNFAKAFEKIFIKYVNLVITVSPKIQDWYSLKYQISNVISVLNCPKFTLPRENNELRKQLGISPEKKICLYQGGFFLGRGIEEIMYFFISSKRKDFVLVLMGYGDLDDYVLKQSNNHANIFHFPAVSSEKLIEISSGADIGLCLIENSCLSYDYCLPNKIFEYSMSNLAVLGSSLNEMKPIIENNGIGKVIHTKNENSFWNSLDDLIEMKKSPKFKRNLEKFSKNFCWEVQESLMIDGYKKYIF